MTPREVRLTRLVEFRTKQHDVQTVELRAARMLLDKAELMLQQGAQQSRNAHENMANTLQQHDQLGWLLACADVEFYKLSAALGAQRKADAVALVEIAAAKEADARRERKQIERSLELISSEVGKLALRADQRHLDESARLLRNASSNPLRSGRFH